MVSVPAQAVGQRRLGTVEGPRCQTRDGCGNPRLRTGPRREYNNDQAP